MTQSPTQRRFLSRRNVLRNAGLLALLAPVLRQLNAGAAGVVAPRRVIFVFSPNGCMKATGPATGTESDFVLHDWWKPLERHQADGIFMSHTASTGAGTVEGGGHALGGQTFSGYGAGVNGDQYANRGETVDQVIGKRLEVEGRGGLKRSLVWGNVTLQQAGGTGDAFCASAGRNISPETNPSKAWAELFASFMAPQTSPEDKARAAALLARNQSVLDFVGRDCVALQDALGAEGMRLLDDHCTTVRTLEKNLVANLPASNACVKSADPGKKDWPNPENIDLQVAAFTDLMAMTLACELSHVIAFQIGAQAARNRLAASYGVPSSPQADSGDSGPAHHPWTHQGDSADKTKSMQIFTSFYASEVALLLDKLKATTDASGKPLLDSTMVLWLSELGGNERNPDAHQTSCIPALLFGRGQGTFKTGRYLRGKSDDLSMKGASYVEAGRDSARLLVSLVRYMGLTDLHTVGAAGVDGPLTSLYG